MLTAHRLYPEGSRRLQDQFDTRRLADRLAEKFATSSVSEKQKDFIQRCDMFFLATADASGRPSCSYKGGDPGFVRVLDPVTLAFPNYDGNGMYISCGNALENPHVGLLFLDFEKGHRLRISGTATIDAADPLLPTFAGAQFVVHVHVEQVYPNCPRYIHKYALVERSPFTPRPNLPSPIPAWKCTPDIRETLPANDPARGV